jgi:hypothetical protein
VGLSLIKVIGLTRLIILLKVYILRWMYVKIVLKFCRLEKRMKKNRKISVKDVINRYRIAMK